MIRYNGPVELWYILVYDNYISVIIKDLRLDLRSWLPDIDQLRGWPELIKSPRADRPKGFGSALSFPEADLWQAAMSENQSQILL